MSEAPLYANEPPSRWGRREADEFLVWASGAGASDIYFTAGEPVSVKIHGDLHRVTRRVLSDTETADILDTVTGSASASSETTAGHPTDFSYEVRVDRATRLRYRGNALGVRYGTGSAVAIVLRTIPSAPPRISELGLEPEWVEAAMPKNGIVLFTGVMGQGKSTTLAAILRERIETRPETIQTLEAPIEFDFNAVKDKRAMVSQAQVPDQVASFSEGVRAITRRASDVLLVGESRDRDTLDRMIMGAEVGVALYSTVHTRSVAATPSRILGEFPPGEQPKIAAALVNSLRVIVQQRLLHRVGGGRVAVREWLVFDAEHRSHLRKVATHDLEAEISRLVREDGRPLAESARLALEQNLISREDAQALIDEGERTHVA